MLVRITTYAISVIGLWWKVDPGHSSRGCGVPGSDRGRVGKGSAEQFQRAGAFDAALIGRAGFHALDKVADVRQGVQVGAGAGGLQLDRDEAEALFIVAVGCQGGSAAGYGCGAQDISTRLSSLIYGATSVFAVLAGAGGQYFTGWLLEQNGRDFTPMFALVVAVELAGLLAWNAWWDSEERFD